MQTSKLPGIIFEYDRLNWYADTYTVTLLADGTLVKVTHAYSKLEATEIRPEAKALK